MQSKGIVSATWAGVSAAVVLAHSPALILAATAAEVPKEIIAVQLRKQGYPCVKPKSAERDEAAKNKFDDAVWILTCEGVRYRVTLIPNMAAKVERLSENTPPAEKKSAAPR